MWHWHWKFCKVESPSSAQLTFLSRSDCNAKLMAEEGRDEDEKERIMWLVTDVCSVLSLGGMNASNKEVFQEKWEGWLKKREKRRWWRVRCICWDGIVAPHLSPPSPPFSPFPSLFSPIFLTPFILPRGYPQPLSSVLSLHGMDKGSKEFCQHKKMNGGLWRGWGNYWDEIISHEILFYLQEVNTSNKELSQHIQDLWTYGEERRTVTRKR